MGMYTYGMRAFFKYVHNIMIRFVITEYNDTRNY